MNTPLLCAAGLVATLFSPLAGAVPLLCDTQQIDDIQTYSCSIGDGGDIETQYQIDDVQLLISVDSSYLFGLVDKKFFWTWPRAPKSIPEPGTLALLGVGLLGVGLAGRRKARRAPSLR